MADQTPLVKLKAIHQASYPDMPEVEFFARFKAKNYPDLSDDDFATKVGLPVKSNLDLVQEALPFVPASALKPDAVDAPEEVTAVSLPGEVGLASVAKTEDTGPSNRRHGLFQVAARTVGGVGAVARDLAGGVADPIDMAARVVTPDKYQRFTAPDPRVTKSRAEISEERGKTLAKPTLEIVADDASNIILALPRVAGEVVGSFEAMEDESSLDAGVRAGSAIVPAFVAAIEESIDSPWETAKAAPISAFLSLVPAVSGLLKLSKIAAATSAGKAVAGSAPAVKAAELAAKVRKVGADAITRRHGPNTSVLRQRWFDLYDAADPKASQFLEEVLQDIPESVGSAARELPELAAGVKAIRRANAGGVRNVQLADKGAVSKFRELTGSPDVPSSPERGPGSMHSVGDIPKITDDMSPAQKAATTVAQDEWVDKLVDTGGKRQIKAGVAAQQAKAASTLAAEEAKNIPAWLDLSADLPDGGVMPRVLESNQRIALPPHIAEDLLHIESKPAMSRGASPGRDRMIEVVERNRGVDGMYRVDTVVDALNKLRVEDAAALKALPKPFRDLANMKTATIGGKKFVTNPQIAYAVEIAEGVSAANTAFSEWFERGSRALTKTVKEVVLPLSPKAMFANLVIGNEFMSAFWGGRAPVLTGASGAWSYGRDYLGYWKKSAAQKAADPNARFFNAIEKTGLIGSDVVTQDIAAMKGLSGETSLIGQSAEAALGGYSKAAEFFGQGQQIGDAIYKLDVSRSSFNLVQELFTDLEVGKNVKVDLTPRTKAVVTKLEDGRYEIKTPLRTEIVEAGSTALDDVAAKFGALKAKSLFFDYGGDLAGWPRFLRNAPAVGAASPFWTWAYRALDVPFGKRGLGHALLSGPTGGLSTNSRAGTKMLAKAEAKTAFGRAMLMAATKDETNDEAYLRRAGAYSNNDALSRAVTVSTNPGALATARYSSANWLGPTMQVAALVDSALSRFVEGTDDLLERVAKEGKLTDEKTLRDLVRRAKSSDPYASALGLVGLGGTMAFDIYAKSLDSEKPGKDFDPMEALESMFVPSVLSRTAEAVADTERGRVDRLAYAPEDPQQQEQRLNWWIRKTIGLGYQMQDSEKDMDRYLRGVRSELTAQADLWKKNRLTDVSELEGAAFTPKRRREIEFQADRIEEAIDAAVYQAERDYTRALHGAAGKAKAAALTPTELRQKAAASRVGAQPQAGTP